MSIQTKQRTLRCADHPDLDRLIAEIAGTVVKAINEPDPTRYVQEAVAEAFEGRRFDDDPLSAGAHDFGRSASLQYNAARNRIVRDLAMEIVEAYERLERVDRAVTRSAIAAVYKKPCGMGAVEPLSLPVTPSPRRLNK